MSGTSIRQEPGGARLLHVLGPDVRREPGGDRLLFVDGSEVREGPGGRVLFFVDGDDVRRHAGGIRLAYVDGGLIRRRPGGAILLQTEHPEVRTEEGTRILFVDGEPLERAQLVAVLHLLRPEVLTLTPEEEGELEREREEAREEEERRASEDPVPGTYDISAHSTSEGPKRRGNVTVRPDGGTYAIGFDSDATFGGVGRREGEEVWVALGAPGVELHVLSAKDKAVQKRKAEPTLENDVATFTVSFQSPAGPRQGVAIQVGDALVAATDPAGGPVEVARWKIDGGNLIGDFFGTGGKSGYYTLTR